MAEQTSKNSQVVLYQDDNLKLEVLVSPTDDTVWLSEKQIADLFGKDVTTISRHISNALKEELKGQEVSKLINNSDYINPFPETSGIRTIRYYNLDVVLSVGYRIKSNRGVIFRKWANGVLNDFLLKGVATNDFRLKELNYAVSILDKSKSILTDKKTTDLLNDFNHALTLLDEYDHNTLTSPVGNSTSSSLDVDECRHVIKEMRFTHDSDLFGKERDSLFEGTIKDIYQMYDGKELYPTIEDKAAHLLYFLAKNHCFVDGNKRIAASLFIYFLNKNGILYSESGEKVIDDDTLFSLTLLVASSNPNDMDLIIQIILNCL